MVKPMLYRPEEAAQTLGLSRARMFELLASGAVESVKIGRSRRIPHAALEEYVAALRGTQSAA